MTPKPRAVVFMISGIVVISLGAVLTGTALWPLGVAGIMFGGLFVSRSVHLLRNTPAPKPYLAPAIDRALRRDHSQCGKNPCSDCR